MATQFASTAATFGLPAAQTGILLDSQTWTYSQDSKQVRDVDGDTIAKAYYDERIEIALAGFVPATTAFSGTIAATIALATTPADYLIGSAGANAIVEGITRTHSNEEFQRLEMNCMYHPGIG
jgi:hypothetical protein